MVVVGLFLVVLFAMALWSKHLVDGPVTPPTILTVVAVAAASVWSVDLGIDTVSFRLLSQVTLSLVLFVDATRIPLRALRSAAGLPARLLSIGLPLSIAAVSATAMVVLGLELGPALLVGAALSATDAALARVVVESAYLPSRLRETINAESGLNDGLASPVVTVAIALTASESDRAVSVVDAAVVPLATAVVVGLAVGWLGGRALTWASGRGELVTVYRQLSGLALVGLVVVASLATGASMFVAAFLAGSAFGQSHDDDTSHLIEFSEDTARLLTLAAFFAFGLVLLPDALAAATLPDLVVVAVALTVGRMVPVAASLVGRNCAPPTQAFIGWFGPRGLATVLFTLIAVEELGAELPQRAVTVLCLTVLASLVLHGATATTLSRWYDAWLERQRRAMDPGASPPDVMLATTDDASAPVTRTRH